MTLSEAPSSYPQGLVHVVDGWQREIAQLEQTARLHPDREVVAISYLMIVAKASELLTVAEAYHQPADAERWRTYRRRYARFFTEAQGDLAIENDPSPTVAGQEVPTVTQSDALGLGIEALREVRNREWYRYNKSAQMGTNPTIDRYDAAIATLVTLREADW
jgi:hypothetical protein